MMMESSGTEPGTGTLITPAIRGLHPRHGWAIHSGRAAERTGRRTAIPAPVRPSALGFAANPGTRNPLRELPGGHLRQVVRRAAEESPEPQRKPESHRTARPQASRANHHLLQRVHCRNPSAPAARATRWRARAAIPPRSLLAPAATAPPLDTRNRRQLPARALCWRAVGRLSSTRPCRAAKSFARRQSAAPHHSTLKPAPAQAQTRAEAQKP